MAAEGEPFEGRDPLDVARELAARFTSSLPESVDLLGPSLRYKTASKAHLLREALIWRMEEMARNAVRCIDAGDTTAAALLTRAAMETMAMLFCVHRLVDHAIRNGLEQDTDDRLTGWLTGSKSWPETPGALNVLTAVGKVRTLIPSFGESYDHLSEAAHPNWAGAHGAYSILDRDKMVVSYASGGENPANRAEVAVKPLAATLSMFEHYYNDLADLILPFARECERYYNGSKT